jgi:pimeloyl-ACP methyl ester carboxylesterase
MDNIAVDGAILSAAALGTADAAPVAMLHGLVTGNMATWYTGFGLPLSTSHRVLLYDQRGHGGSTMPGSGFDLKSQAHDLDQVLANYGYGATPVDLVGYSMGALIALRFALDHPRRIRRLVLVDAPMPASLHVAPSLRRLAADAAIAPSASGPRGRRRERFMQRVQSLLTETSLLQDVAAMQAEPDVRLSHFDKPVMLFYGTCSPCRDAGLHLQRVLPRATLCWLEAGHELPAEVPQLLLRGIEDFIDRPDPPAHRPHLHVEVA